MATVSSGISITQATDDAFGEARVSQNVRFLKIQIEGESIVVTAKQPVVGTAEQDFGLIQQHLEAKTPCYITYRLDTKNMHGYEWLLISYVPDGSPVKQRMLYASSHATLKRQLGMTYFSEELHGSETSDITWELFQQHDKNNRANDAPLTQTEMAKGAVAELEIDQGRTREYVHSVLFPMSSQASAALKNFDSNNIVQLTIDQSKETIELLQASQGAFSSIGGKLPKDEPCFTFVQFTHTHDGETQKPVIFIYYCPDTAKVKSKMLYSTVKAAAIDAATQLGVKVDKKLEITETDELVESELLEELHPASREVNVKGNFDRPSRPGRGRPRMLNKRT